MDKALDNWFKREIVVHEAALRRYIGRVWPYSHEVYDILQETYVRVYEAGKRSHENITRSYIFTVARNLMSDRLRHSRVISMETVSDPDALNVLVDEATPEREVGAWQELRRVIRALNALPARSREVIWLRRVDRLSNREVARLLGLSERTVENHLLRGLRALGDALFAGTSFSTGDDEKKRLKDKAEHGTQ